MSRMLRLIRAVRSQDRVSTVPLSGHARGRTRVAWFSSVPPPRLRPNAPLFGRIDLRWISTHRQVHGIELSSDRPAPTRGADSPTFAHAIKAEPYLFLFVRSQGDQPADVVSPALVIIAQAALPENIRSGQPVRAALDRQQLQTAPPKARSAVQSLVIGKRIRSKWLMPLPDCRRPTLTIAVADISWKAALHRRPTCITSSVRGGDGCGDSRSRTG